MRIRADLPDITIMVSRRIDVNSVSVDNPLYYPMRCGACFDTNPHSVYAGDDSGDNISEKRMSYCELTVQYWAWKNLDADYYGLCHYRRYLSFANRQYRTNEHGLVDRAILNEKECQRFGLLNSVSMAEQIAQYDMIIPQAAPVNKMPLPRGKARTVREMWLAHEGIFFPFGTVSSIEKFIAQIAPEYAQVTTEYLSGTYHCGYNCYVMKKKLFERLCLLQFSVMAEIPLSDDFPRTRAYVGEILFGIFCYSVKMQGKYRVRERQLVMFEHTEKVKNCVRYAEISLQNIVNQIVRRLAAPIFPLGSERREYAKTIYKKLLYKTHN